MSATWTRLIRFIAVEKDGEHYGEPLDHPDHARQTHSVDVGLMLSEQPSKVVLARVWAMKSPWDGEATYTGEVLTVKTLLTPIPVEGCVRAVGLNYKDHAASHAHCQLEVAHTLQAEMKLALPDVPSVFIKPPNTIAQPGQTVVIPAQAQDEEMDYEVELAITLSKQCKNVSEEEAMDHILGYTCANDLTARKVQDKSTQWGYAKGFDHFLPLGPVLLSPRALPDPSVLRLRTYLNGEIMQDGFASSMIFSIPKIISYLSQGTTLPAGTVIITGTPSGIGNGRNPRVWLKDGDQVRCHISHGIGSLVSHIQYESA